MTVIVHRLRNNSPASVADARLWWLGILLMLAGLLVPVLCVSVPPLTDYPNHLARAFILAHPLDPVLARMFAPRWAVLPNLATDLILPPLIRLLPVLVAGRVVVALAVLLPATGAIAFNRVAFGRRSWWPLGAGLVSYNTMLLIGTLNFQIGAGLALWGGALWLALRAQAVARVLTGAACAVACFFCHLFGLAFFGLLIGAAAIAEVGAAGLATATSRRLALRRGLEMVLVLAPAALLYLASPFAHSGGDIVWQSFGKKCQLLLVPVLAYSRPLGLALAAAILLPLLVWRWRRRLAVLPLAPFVFVSLLAAYAVLPVGAKGGYWVDTRMPVLLGFCLFALLAPRATRLGGRWVGAVLAVAFCAHIAVICGVWRRADTQIAAVRWVVQPLAPGSRVLVIDGGIGRDGLNGQEPASGLGGVYRHDGAFALLDRRAFFSDIFALPGQQPLALRPPYDRLSDLGADPPPNYGILAEASDPPSPASAAYARGWAGKYDDVLLLNAAAATDPKIYARPELRVVRRDRFAVLFRIDVAAMASKHNVQP